MTRPFLVLICFLIAAQIDGFLGDPRTQTSRPSHGVKHDESRSKQSSLDDHKSQTRSRAQRNHVHESKVLSNENNNFMNLENVLFDREQLKNYVLDYLRTHGFSQSSATGDKNSLDHKRKPGGRHNEHRDKLTPSNHGRKHKDRNPHVDNRDSRHHPESNHKNIPRESFLEKEKTTHTDTSHQTLKHYHRSDRHGHLKRDEIVSKSDVSSHSLKHKGKHKNTKGLNHKKSNKRDFIAVLPPQSFKLEGFDVQPVHPKLSHDKRKRKATKTQRHKDIKMNESQKQLNEHEKKARRKSDVASKSHDHKIKSQWQREGRKRIVTQKSKSSDDKDSNKHKGKSKNSVHPALSKDHPQEKVGHDVEHKNDIVHRKEKSTTLKRKKISRHRDTKEAKFSPSWKSLDKRKIPSWYDDAKFGIFVHWGLYSVPSFDSEWFWYKWKGRQLQKYLNYTGKNFPPGFSYNEFAPLFKAEFFDAKQWAELVARSGARYFVFTSKHHEGFTNWNSSVAWNWNSVDIGPHRNIVDELARAFRNLSDPQVKFGLYYSLFEWFNPHYLKDKANGFKTDEYIKAVMRPQLYDLVNTYKPDYLWADGDWEANYTYWKSTEFLAWLFNDSPVKDTVVVNDRWGRGCRCHHGGVYTGADRYNPGKLQKMKWENAMTIDRHSWGFRRDANLKDYFSIEELIVQLVSTVSCGGNLLMNVGPASDGTISPIFQERLTQMGDWLKVNGDAIYKTRPWRVQNDSVSGDVWYTSKGKEVFAITLSWPRSGKLVLGDPTVTDQTRVTMLGTKTHIKWTHGSKHKGGKSGIVIHVPAIPVSDLPCLWAWVFKLSHVK